MVAPRLARKTSVEVYGIGGCYLGLQTSQKVRLGRPRHGVLRMMIHAMGTLVLKYIRNTES